MLLNEDSHAGKKSFILGFYQNEKKAAIKNYPFLQEKTPAILNYLSKGFVDIWKEDLNSIKAYELLDPAVIEFITNEEAYNYFKKKAAENKSKIAEHYKYFGPDADFKDVVSYEKINTLFLSNDYLSRKNEETSQKKMIMLLPFSAHTLLKAFQLEGIRVKAEEFNSNLKQYIAGQQTNNKVSKLDDLSFGDQHLVYSLVNLCGKEIKMDSDFDPVYGAPQFDKSKENWTEIYPEIYSLFRKNEISELYICIPRIAHKSGVETSNVILFYYKISLPSKNKTTLIGTKSQWSVGDLRDESEFFREANRELSLFIKKSGD